jgi:hypothetical protein
MLAMLLAAPPVSVLTAQAYSATCNGGEYAGGISSYADVVAAVAECANDASDDPVVAICLPPGEFDSLDNSYLPEMGAYFTTSTSVSVFESVCAAMSCNLYYPASEEAASSVVPRGGRKLHQARPRATPRTAVTVAKDQVEATYEGYKTGRMRAPESFCAFGSASAFSVVLDEMLG